MCTRFVIPYMIRISARHKSVNSHKLKSASVEMMNEIRDRGLSKNSISCCGEVVKGIL